MEYGLLGPFRVLDDKGAEVQPSAPKVRTLLALLLLNRGRSVSVDRIADALWGDEPPRSAPNLVHGYVRDLRRRLGIHGISTVTGGYRLDVPRVSVDAFRFEDLVQARRYGEALTLWRGPALVGWADQPWARAIATRLEEERLAALESRLTQDIDAGLASLVVGEIGALVEDHPLRERLRVLLVKALYATGRQAEALEAYAQARRYLVDEVGLEPGAELRAVEAAVLAQDSTLVPAPPRPAAAPPVPVTPLVGRERELAMLRRALTAARLVSLAGPGGVGKTRLAVELLATPSSRAGRCGSWSLPLCLPMPMSPPLWLGHSSWPSRRGTRSISSATICRGDEACSSSTLASMWSRERRNWPPPSFRAVPTSRS